MFANIEIPRIWEDLLSDNRSSTGFVYAEGTNLGNIPLVKALKVKGFDYVLESLWSNTSLKVANNLLTVHFEGNNFYIKIGNGWGVSWEAQYTDKILINLTPNLIDGNIFWIKSL